MKRFAALVILILLVSPSLFAAENISGKWTGTLAMTKEGNPPETRSGPVILVLTQVGTSFTGTMGPSEDQPNAATLKGTVETVKADCQEVTNVVLDMTPAGDDLAMRFTLTVKDGHLAGKGQDEFAGQKFTGVLDVTRAK